MQKGDIWKDGGEIADYLAMTRFASENGFMFARNANGDFEIMDMPEPALEESAVDPKDERIAALEQRLEELEAVIAALGA